MEYDNFGNKITSKRDPSFIPNRINGISGKQIISGSSLASDLEMEGNALFAFRQTFSESEAVDGYRLGIDQFDNKGKFYIGDETHFFVWDGFNATINGVLYSTEGDIAGWTITTDALTGDRVQLLSTGRIISGDFTGQRVELDGFANSITFYDENGDERGQIYGTDTFFSGTELAVVATENLLLGVPDGMSSYRTIFMNAATGELSINLFNVTNGGNFDNLGDLYVGGTLSFGSKQNLDATVTGCPLPVIENAYDVIRGLPDPVELSDTTPEKGHYGERLYISEIAAHDAIKYKGEIEIWHLVGVLTQALKDTINKVDELERIIYTK